MVPRPLLFCFKILDMFALNLSGGRGLKSLQSIELKRRESESQYQSFLWSIIVFLISHVLGISQIDLLVLYQMMNPAYLPKTSFCPSSLPLLIPNDKSGISFQIVISSQMHVFHHSKWQIRNFFPNRHFVPNACLSSFQMTNPEFLPKTSIRPTFSLCQKHHLLLSLSHLIAVVFIFSLSFLGESAGSTITERRGI